MISEIRCLLAPALAYLRNAQQRREFALALRTLAEEQQRLAEADQRLGHVVRRAQLDAAPRSAKGGRPKGSGARFLRWEGRIKGRTGQLYVGRALWQELGEPARMDVQRLGTELVLRPCGADVGWAVIKPSQGMPHMSIGDEAAAALRLIEGRHPAEVRGGEIVALL